jgi:hypothetical protein
MTGCGERPPETEGTPDPEKVDVPAGDKERVGRAQRGRTTRSPAQLAQPACRGRDAGSHVTSQLRGERAYSVLLAYRWPGFILPGLRPARPALSDSALFGSALADPADPRLGGRIRRPVLAVAPGPARAVLVMLLTAGHADHASIVLFRLADGAVTPRIPESAGRAGQAAFARRIRRRRSAARSSSLSPPQVPYFSGRPTA